MIVSVRKPAGAADGGGAHRTSGVTLLVVLDSFQLLLYKM